MSLKSFILPVSICLGLLSPSLHMFSWMIAPLLSIILFFTFLKNPFSITSFQNHNIYHIILANITLGILSVICIRPFSDPLALSIFFITIAPTASAAPAVTHLLNGNVQHVTATMIASTITSIISIPTFLWIFFDNAEISISPILLSMASVVFIPLIIAKILQYISPKLAHFFTQKSHYSFWIWAIAIFLALSKTANFILQINFSQYLSYIIILAIMTGLLCFFQFWIGKKIGKATFPLESSQSLGQKNTLLVTYIALQFYSPLIALGPLFYIIAHNIFNSFQIAKYEYAKKI